LPRSLVRVAFTLLSAPGVSNAIQLHWGSGADTLTFTDATRVTAHFCSGGSSAAERATFVLDLPAWGRSKVIARDPRDTGPARRATSPLGSSLPQLSRL
jgi:hypothetical protein